MALKFYSSVVKVLQLKVRKILGLVPTFVELTGEKTDWRTFLPSILNRVKGALRTWKVSKNYFDRFCEPKFSSFGLMLGKKCLISAQCAIFQIIL